MRPHPFRRPRMLGRPGVIATTFAVVVLLSLSLFSGLSAAANPPARSAAVAVTSVSPNSPPVPRLSTTTATTSSAISLNGASAGSVISTAFVNYNRSFAGNFPSAVWDWAAGQSTIDPVTDQLWIPTYPVVLDGVPASSYAPGLVYSPAQNQTQLVLHLNDTSAVAYDPLTGDLYATQLYNNVVTVYNATTEFPAQLPIPVGTRPVAILYDPASENLYVANEGSNNVTVINGSTNDVIVGGIAAGTGPTALADDTTDRILFIADSGADRVSTISTRTNTAGSSSIPVASPASALAYSKSQGLLAVGLPASATLIIYHAANQAYAGTATIGKFVSSIIANQSGADFVATNGTAADLILVQATTGVITPTLLSVGQIPTRLTLDPTNGRIYAWSNGSRTITTISPTASGTIQVSPDLGVRAAAIAYDPSSGHIFVADRTINSLAVLDVSTFATVRSPVSLPGAPISIVDDPQTGTIYVGYAGGVAAIDASTGSITASNNTLRGNNSQLVIDPATDRLWDLNNVTGLEVLSLPNLDVVQVIGIGVGTSNLLGMTLDNATDQLFFVDRTNYTIAVFNGVTGQEILPFITGVSGAISVAYDAADQAVYALGISSVYAIDPATHAFLAGPIAIAPHLIAWSISYDPSREFLDVASSDLPALTGNLTVIDGSSIAASKGTYATIGLGQIALDAEPVILPGSSAPGSGEIWAPNIGSGTVSIIASPPQVTFLAASPDPIDAGVAGKILLGYVGGAGPSTVSYSGLPASCTSSNTLALNCTPDVNGSYWVNATVVDSLGFATYAQTLLSVAPAISVALSLTLGPSGEVDVGSSLSSSASATGGTAPYNYSWAFGDATRAWGTTVDHTYSAVGTYVVSVTTTDSGGGVSAASGTVTVVPLPNATISVSPGPATDVNVPTHFSANVSGGASPGIGSWTFSNGGSANGTTATYTDSTSGVYLATFHYRDASGVTINKTVTITVNPALAVSLTVSPPASSAAPAVGSSILFVATVSGGTPAFTIVWAFDDGSYASGTSAQHTYGSAGTYTVTLTVVDGVGTQVNTTYQLVVGSSTSTSGLGSNFDSGLLLGLVIGAVAAAVVLFATTRAKRGPPPPASPYVPPAVTNAPSAPPSPWNEE
jgi:YVTN family beta-propeller protein